MNEDMIHELKIDGKIITDRLHRTNKFNDYCTNIESHLANKIPLPKQKGPNANYMKQYTANSVFKEPVSTEMR
jgi:hypothetical protein